MDNKELIKRLISFDDDGVDTSTGYVSASGPSGRFLGWPAQIFGKLIFDYIPKSTMWFQRQDKNSRCKDRENNILTINKVLDSGLLGFSIYPSHAVVVIDFDFPGIDVDDNTYISYDDVVSSIKSKDIRWEIMSQLCSNDSVYRGFMRNFPEDPSVAINGRVDEVILPVFERLRKKLLNIIEKKMKPYCQMI